MSAHSCSGAFEDGEGIFPSLSISNAHRCSQLLQTAEIVPVSYIYRIYLIVASGNLATISEALFITGVPSKEQIPPILKSGHIK